MFPYPSLKNSTLLPPVLPIVLTVTLFQCLLLLLHFPSVIDSASASLSSVNYYFVITSAITFEINFMIDISIDCACDCSFTSTSLMGCGGGGDRVSPATTGQSGTLRQG